MQQKFNTATAVTTEYDPAAVLNFLAASGVIDISGVANDMKQSKLKKILADHPYPITQGKDGRYRTYVKNGNGKRRQIAKSTLEKVHEELYHYYSDLEAGICSNSGTVAKLYPSWIEYKRLHASSSTYLKRIDSDWRNYYEGTSITQKPLNQLTKLDLDVWAHSLIEQVGRSKKQYYNVSMIMRQILDYAVDMELIPSNPYRKVQIESRMVFDPTRKKSSETQVFTKDEVNALYQAAWDEYENDRNTIHKLAPLAVMFQFQTGLRIGELCAIRYEDIVGDEIFVNRMYRFETKEIVPYTKGHNSGRYVTLTAEAKKLIGTAQAYQHSHGLSDSGYIFSVDDNPLSYYAVRKAYSRYCDAVGCLNKSSHKARKTYISALIDGGVNINEIRELVGHADERTTYNAYCFDRTPKKERAQLIEAALQ